MNNDNKDFVDLSGLPGSDGRRDSQSGWHTFVGHLFSNTTFIDVGSGLGGSKSRMSINNNQVILLEPAPNMPADIRGIIDDQEDDSYEIVTAFDVIEHIPNDKKFLDNLLRVSKLGVFITTPNFNVFGCYNKYHIREYKPEELADMCTKEFYTSRFFVCGRTDGFGAMEVPEEVFRKTKEPALAVFLKKKSAL